MAIIILFVRARAGKSNSFSLAPYVQILIDKLTAVSESKPNREKGMRVRILWIAVPTRFCPLPQTRYIPSNRWRINCCQGIQKETIYTIPTMSHQVNFQETGTMILPVSKGTNRNGILQQTTRSGGREMAPISLLTNGRRRRSIVAGLICRSCLSHWRCDFHIIILF